MQTVPPTIELFDFRDQTAITNRLRSLVEYTVHLLALVERHPDDAHSAHSFTTATTATDCAAHMSDGGRYTTNAANGVAEHSVEFIG